MARQVSSNRIVSYFWFIGNSDQVIFRLGHFRFWVICCSVFGGFPLGLGHILHCCTSKS